MPLLVGVGLVAVAVIGVLIFLATRGDSPAPVPTPPPATRQTEPVSPPVATPTPSVSRPAQASTDPVDPPERDEDNVTIDQVPAEVDGWVAHQIGDGMVLYTSDSTDGAISVLSFGTILELKIWAYAIEGEPTESADGRVVCGTSDGLPQCYVATRQHGVVSIDADDASVPLDVVTRIAEGLAATVP